MAGSWPTVPGGLGGSADWAEVEPLFARLLTALQRSAVDGEGVLLFYMPYTDLGREHGDDCSWEAQLNLVTGEGVRVLAVGLGADPVLAVEEMSRLRWTLIPSTSPSTPKPAAPLSDA